MPAMGMTEMKSSFDLLWNPSSQMYTAKGQALMAGSWTVIVEAHKNGGVIVSSRAHLNAK